jgi:hypothetical protein
VLHNIRCFRDLDLDFASDGGMRPWTILLGDNGLGKTTILPCIGMAVCDETNAAALMRALPGEMLRDWTEEGTIHVELGFRGGQGESAWTETRLRRDRDGLVQLKQSYSNWFPRDRLFMCGYGALRQGFGNEIYPEYQLKTSVESLFDYKKSLQNPELAFRRASSAGHDLETIRRRIETVLMLPPESIRIDSKGIAITGPWGNFVPAMATGDGYQATLAWVADMFGWSFAFRPSSPEIAGVVLIDEIEKHLHPRWQREIVRQLGAQFPAVQFVATTHSPICTGGLADLEPGMGLMYYFKSIARGDVVGEAAEPFSGWRYDQIITSDAFGLASARDVSTEAIIERMRRAYE